MSLMSSLKSLGASLKSLRASHKLSLKSCRSSLKSFTSSHKSSLKSLPTLSCLPCLGHSFTNYVMQICLIWTHPTHMTYYGDTLVNETNTISPSTILKISLSRNTYLQLDLQTIMNTVKTWCDEWLLRLNTDKCKMVLLFKISTTGHSVSYTQ